MRNKQKKYRFILSGGGTGGHLFPAIAIANQLKIKYPDAEFLFVGAKGRIEMEKVPISGYPIIGLWISGFQRNEIWKNIALPFKLIYSFACSISICLKFKPDIAIGTGGYASFPILFIASLFKIPTLIQEQNFFPGISNKLLAKKVNRICTVYPGMEKYFPKDKIIITGNPIREDIRISNENKAKYYEVFGLNSSKKTLLVLGGSLGAKTINEAMLLSREKLIENNIQIIWQTGRYFDEISNRFDLHSCENYWIGAFINNMAAAYAISDLIISRSGAITLSELAVMEKPCILIPSPNVTEDHQTKNAMALVDSKAALMLKDSECREKMGELVVHVISDDSILSSLSENIKAFSMPESTHEIVTEIENLINRK